MENKRSLANGWIETTLGEVTTIIMGQSPESSSYNTEGNGIALINGPAEFGKGDFGLTKEIKYTTETTKLCEQGDLILCIRASIGKTNIAGFKACIGRGVAAIRAFLISQEYINYYVVSQKNYFQSIGTGTTFMNISSNQVSSLKFLLPPLAEQNRIVTELDTYFEWLGEAETALSQVPILLKQFRQKVLSMAVSGDLTRDWREGNTEGGEHKYMEEIAEVIDTHPSHRTPPSVESGIPYIGMGDVKKGGIIDFQNARKVGLDILEEHKKRYTLKEGDFIFGKIGTIGQPTKLPLPQNYAISPNVILVQPKIDCIETDFLYYYLSSTIFEEEVKKELRTALQPLLGIKKMKSFLLEIPSINEQKEIVKRVEELLNIADEIEADYQKAQTQLKVLPQMLLQKAFRGELAPQYAGDESAEILLKKIKEEKEIISKKTHSKSPRHTIKLPKKSDMTIKEALSNQSDKKLTANELWRETRISYQNNIENFYAELKTLMAAEQIVEYRPKGDDDPERFIVLKEDKSQ